MLYWPAIVIVLLLLVGGALILGYAATLQSDRALITANPTTITSAQQTTLVNYLKIFWIGAAVLVALWILAAFLFYFAFRLKIVPFFLLPLLAAAAAGGLLYVSYEAWKNAQNINTASPGSSGTTAAGTATASFLRDILYVSIALVVISVVILGFSFFGTQKRKEKDVRSSSSKTKSAAAEQSESEPLPSGKEVQEVQATEVVPGVAKEKVVQTATISTIPAP